jgi:hypothetical protein
MFSKRASIAVSSSDLSKNSSSVAMINAGTAKEIKKGGLREKLGTSFYKIIKKQ